MRETTSASGPRAILGRQGKSLEEQLAEEAAVNDAIHHAVSAGLQHLLPYLSDREGLAAPVAEALGHYREHASWLVPAIDEALATQSNEHVRQFLTESKVQLITGSLPKEPEDAPPAERARWIFAHPTNSRDDGHRVVELLLAGRDVSELSSAELLLLAKGYNWWGNHAKSFETAKLALARDPHSIERLRLAGLYASNAFCHDLSGFVAACDGCITEGLGPAAFWCLLKADRYAALATGERELEDFEWSPGDPILHPEFLRPAAEALEAALSCEPGLRQNEAARGWVGDWNQRFAAVLQDPTFRHLT